MSTETEKITCDNVFSEWSLEHLQILGEEKGIRYREKSGEDLKDTVIDALVLYTRNSGLNLLLSALPAKLLENLTSKLSESILTKNGRNPKSRSTRAKRLLEYLTENLRMSLVEFTIDSNHFNRDEQVQLLQQLLEFFGSEYDENASRKKLYKAAEEEIETCYLRNILTQCPPRFLQAVCEYDGVLIDHGACTSSNILSELIIQGLNYYEYAESQNNNYEREVPAHEKRPKKISSRCNKADLMHWFKASELKQYCDDNNVKSSGKKIELAQRIMDFLDEDKENKDHLMKGYKKPKAEKKQGKGLRKKRISRGPKEVMTERSVSSKKRGKKIQEDTMDIDSETESESM